MGRTQQKELREYKLTPLNQLRVRGWNQKSEEKIRHISTFD